MRTIKFRAWNRINETMIAVANLSFGHDGSGKTILIDGENTANRFLVEGESGVLMQFTGLTDKNGKEIYEGDIVKSETAALATVTYESTEFLAMVQVGEDEHHNLLCFDGKDTEIVGNIYENPDLLPAKVDNPT